MSQEPRLPSAARSPYGPEGEPKASVDVTHRVRREAKKATSAIEASMSGGQLVLSGMVFTLALGYLLGWLKTAR